MIAHGDTVIAAGDLVTAYANPEIHETVYAQFGHVAVQKPAAESPTRIPAPAYVDSVQGR